MSVSDEDKRLFLEALGEVERKPEGERAPARSPSGKAKEISFAELLDQSMSHPDLLEKRRVEKTPPQAKPRREIEASIDLHASTLEVALRRTEEFVLRCHLRRFHKVLIIHGKGSGVLRDGVRRYLEHHPLVAQITSAGKHQGGDGAVVVLLRA